MTTSKTLIKIAPTKAEKIAQKERNKAIEVLASEATPHVEKGYVSKRHEDLFQGGPLHNMTVVHCPNGPTHDWDPDRHHADYYVRDKMRLDQFGPKIPGYHIYSTSRALEEAHRIDGAVKHTDHASTSPLKMGMRGPLHRKIYWYAGFMSEMLAALDGAQPADFTGILSLS